MQLSGNPDGEASAGITLEKSRNFPVMGIKANIVVVVGVGGLEDFGFVLAHSRMHVSMRASGCCSCVLSRQKIA